MSNVVTSLIIIKSVLYSRETIKENTKRKYCLYIYDTQSTITSDEYYTRS